MTIYQPGGQRPYNLSIFNAVIGPFRKRWMFYDLMSAESITGQMDNCLFSLHMPQKLGKIIGDEGGLVKRMARFRIDGLPIEHAQYGTGHTGPISWITSGRLDAVLDIKFPYHPDEQVDLRTIFDQIGRNVATITNSGVLDSNDIYENLNTREGPKGVIPGNSRLARPPLRAPQAPPRELSDDEKETKREVTVDIDLRFRDLKAAVPMFTSDLSMTNNAIIRPVVAFIKYVPLFHL
jgi:distribution and morphology protein 31